MNANWKMHKTDFNCGVGMAALVSWLKFSFTISGKTYTGEGSASFEKLENLFGDQREDSLTSLEVCKLLKKNCCISLSCLPSGLQSCFQAIWSFPLYKISLTIWSFNTEIPQADQEDIRPKVKTCFYINAMIITPSLVANCIYCKLQNLQCA